MRSYRVWLEGYPGDNEPVSVEDHQGPREAACAFVAAWWEHDPRANPDDANVVVDDGVNRSRWTVTGEPIMHWSARPTKERK